MSLPTTWRTERVAARYMRASDLAHVAAMLSRESVCEHLFFGPNTPQETQAYFAPLLRDMESSLRRRRVPPSPVFTIFRPSDGRFIGQGALLPVAYADRTLLVGYQLDEPHWGQGYGTWTARFLVQHAFCAMGSRRLSADCFASNVGSIRVLEKAGFQHEGRQRQRYAKNSHFVDNMLFGLLRDELPTEELEAWRDRLEAETR